MRNILYVWASSPEINFVIAHYAIKWVNVSNVKILIVRGSHYSVSELRRMFTELLS